MTMPNLDFNIERLSFWLGFIAATLLWWVMGRIRPLLPQWNRQFRQYIQVLSRRNFSSVEEYLRRETLRTAQRQHVAAALFSLDEILIQPWLLIPPGGQNPEADDTETSIARHVVPYLPDWPELGATFGAPVLTPAHALLSGKNLALIGHPGSGKTVALAQLASQLSHSDSGLAALEDAVTIYLHVNDLDQNQFELPDSLAVLCKASSDCANLLMQPQIPRFLKSVFRDEQRKVILLLDGLDEVPAESLKLVVIYLQKLLEKQPRLQIVVTASIDYLDGLAKAGFYPLALAAWSQTQRIELMNKWGHAWNNHFLTSITKHSRIPDINPLLMDYWLSAENVYSNPLEWTLRLWGANAGDLKGSSVIQSLETHLKRFLPDPSQGYALEQLATALIQKRVSSLSYNELDQILSRINPQKTISEVADLEEKTPAASDGTIPKPGQAFKKKGKRLTHISSQSENLLNTLIGAGILIDHANHQVRFCNPLFLAFLGSKQLAPDQLASMARGDHWSVEKAALQYAAARSETLDWVHELVTEPDNPLYQNLLTAARWLRDAPANAEWRFSLMRLLVNHIQDEQIPFIIRVKMIGAFYLSREPSAAKFFRQLLTSKSVLIRRLGLLGCGAVGNPQSIGDILALMADPHIQVRSTACIALAAIPEEASLNAVIEILHHGDEEIRQAAAEALALHEEKGHQVLREAAQDKDLLTRRASVYGLQRVAGSWARKILEQLSVEDGQWIVRSAAAQALEVLQNTTNSLPEPLPAPSDSPWLIAFSSRLGIGVLPGQPATEVLINVLKSGSPAEQEAALVYLREQPDDQVIAEIYNLLASGSERVQEAAFNALWWMVVSGLKLPIPVH